MNYKEDFKKIINENNIVLFMKGTKDMPVCGFSNTVVSVLNHYGVDLKEFNYDRDQKEKNPKFRIIYAGTISVRKGIIYLLEAFNQLDLENSELMLIEDIEKDLTSRLNKYKKNKKIVFKKSMKQSDLKKYYNISDVFVLNSIEDGFELFQLIAHQL